jgi:NAD(P)-dependent dehydrogenase (short-subunit alcohol dehydrogenase family)
MSAGTAKQTDHHFGRKSTAEEVSEGIDLSGRHAIVTGATAGIGLETARVIALRGGSVTMACRDLAKAEAVRQRFVREGAGRIRGDQFAVEHLDLASLASVRAFAKSFLLSETPIHLLINNAGLMIPDRRETLDGFEAHFGTNYLGHFLLTTLLLDRIRESAPARIVNVASDAMHFASLTPAFDDLNWEQRRWSGWRSYGNSKLMNLMFTNELNRRLAGSDVESFALHPGIVRTDLARDQGPVAKLFGALILAFSKSAEQGAATTLYAATRADLSQPGANYLSHCAPARTPKLAGRAEVEKALWEHSLELTASVSEPVGN